MNMKRLFSTIMVTAIAVTMMAIPAKKGMWSTIKLADGTTVTAQKAGDENQHWMQTKGGVCYVKNADGVYEQASIEKLTAKRQLRSSARRKVTYASTNDGLGQKGTMSLGAVPSIGEYVIPVVMVQFSDTKFQSTTTVEKMTRFYNEEGYHDETGAVGSVRDYFKAQSGGQFVPTFEVVGIVTLSNKASYYGGNDYQGSDQNLDKLPGHVVTAAMNQLSADFSKYVVPAGDSNHTKGVPLLCMFYAGMGEATEPEGTADDTIWPCEWDCDANYEGVHFNSCFVGNELLTYRDKNNNVTGNTLMGMAVFCHEFGHALGLPDFYVTDYSYKEDDPFGNWSIMDTGAYLDDECRSPIGYNAYEKSYLGWLELKEIGTVEEIVLQSPDGLAEKSAYIIRNSSTECFIFENRQPGTWYPEDLGSGVMVTRIAYKYNDWRTNTLNNTQNKKRACILTADGSKLYYSADKANLYGNGKNSIASLKLISGSAKNIGITNITKNDDGTITLTLNGSGSSGGGGTGNGAYEKVTSASQIAVGNEYVLFSSDYSLANGPFDFKYLTSVEVEVDGNTISGDGLAPMTLGGAANGYSLKIGDQYVTSTAAKALSLTDTESKIWTITSTDDGYVVDGGSTLGKIQFNYNSGNNPRFMNYTSGQKPAVLYLKKTTTGIENVKVAAVNNDNRIYTLDGRYVGNDYSTLSRGLYIINGKKVVK